MLALGDREELPADQRSVPPGAADLVGGGGGAALGSAFPGDSAALKIPPAAAEKVLQRNPSAPTVAAKPVVRLAYELADNVAAHLLPAYGQLLVP